MKKSILKLLSVITVFSMLAATVCITGIGAAADKEAAAANAVTAAASEYVQANKNAVTPWGLLSYVKTKTGDNGITLDYSGGKLDGKAPGNTNYATGAEADFYIQHSQRGMTEKLVNGQAPAGNENITIDGVYGAVTAVFRNVADANTVCFAEGFAPEAPEIIEIDASKIAVMGYNHTEFNIKCDADGNVSSVPATGVQKIVFPRNYAGTMKDQSSSGSKSVVNEVKTVLINNPGYNNMMFRDSAFRNWKNLVAAKIGPSNGTNWIFGNGEGATSHFKNVFRECTSLKYFQCDTKLGGIFYGANYYADSTFQGCESLETVNFPEFDTWAKTKLGWFSFNGTRVRDFVLPEFAFLEPTLSGVEATRLTNGIRNVVEYTTDMTFARAVALSVAKATEMWENDLLNSNAVTTIKSMISGSHDSSSYQTKTEVTWTELISEDYVGGTLTVKFADDSASIEFKKMRPKGLEGINIGHAITPAFDSEVTAYTATVPNDVTAILSSNIKLSINKAASLVLVTDIPDLKVGIPQDIVIKILNSEGKEITYTVTVKRKGSGDASDMIEKINEAADKLELTNATTQEEFLNALKEKLGDGYTLTITDYYKYNAISGANDYSGIIVPGHNGCIAAVLTATDGTAEADVAVKAVIKPGIKEYTYTESEVSKDSDFELEDDGKYLVAYNGNAKKIVIPDGVEEIGFNWNNSDKADETLVLVIPDSVKYLPTNLGYGMLHLEAVSLGDGISRIEDQDFYQNIFLQYVKLPNYLKTIGYGAFQTTATLSEIYLPETLETIESRAFCNSLIRTVNLPANVTKIGSEAFYSTFNVANHLVDNSDTSTIVLPKGSPYVSVIQSIIDKVVDYYEDGEYIGDTISEAPIGDSSRGDVTVTPRITTVLNGGAEVVLESFSSQDIWCSGANIIRAKADSNVAKTITEKLASVSTGGKVPSIFKGVKVTELDMTFAEIIARAQVTLDNCNMSKDIKAEDIIKNVNSSFVSGLSTSLAWAEDLTVTTKEDGKTSTAVGALELKSGNVSAKLSLNREFENKNIELADDKVEEPTEKPNNTPVSTGHPITLSPNCRFAYINWETNELEVLEDTTVAMLLDYITVEDGYQLEFYDDNGEYIPEEYYSVAYLEDYFVFRVLKGYNVAEELSAKVVNVIIPKTGDVLVDTVLLILCISAAGFIFLYKKYFAIPKKAGAHLK